MARIPRPFSRPLSERTVAVLERLQEGHEPWLLMPGAARGVGNRALAQSFGFHFEIDLGIDVGGIDGDMPKPSADRVDVDARPKLMDSRCMPDNVRADALGANRRNA